LVRTIIAFLVASFVPALIGAALTPIPPRSAFLVGFYAYSLLAALLFGVPAFLILRYLGLIRWWTATGTGLLVGALLGLVLRLPYPPEARDVLIMGLSGTATGLTFWLIWKLGRRGNPVRLPGK
jgi:hypothetical protein